MSDPQLKPAFPGHGRTSRSPAVLRASGVGCVGCADGAPVQPVLGHILVVKDDPALVVLLRLQLQAAGYAVEVVASGEEALGRARSDRPAAG